MRIIWGTIGKLIYNQSWGLCLSGNQQHSSISFQAELTSIKNNSILKKDIKSTFPLPLLSLLQFLSLI